MNEHIDKWKLHDYINDVYGDKEMIMVDEVLEILEEAPKEDVAPIKHGKWIESTTRLNIRCSSCDTTIANIKFRYCPNCGAKMGDG